MSAPDITRPGPAGGRAPAFRLRDLSFSLRLAITGFVLVALIGYGVAMVNLVLTYEHVDGRAGLSAEDMKRSFYGNRTNTLLARTIDGGSMEQYLKSPTDKGAILSWIQDGARKETFAAVQAIFDKSCVMCHKRGAAMGHRPLEKYEDAVEVAQIDRGESFPTWARVAHTHIQSIGLILLALAVMFALTGAPEWLKRTVIVTGFAAVPFDFIARAVAHHWPPMVYGMMAGGALMGLSFAIMSAAVLGELWLPRRTAD